MSVPKPTGLTCRQVPGWAYLTVPVKRGHTQTVEYLSQGVWYAAANANGEWLLPVHQVGETEWRARYTHAEEHSPWATGRVWAPDGFETDDPSPEPLPTPTNLRNCWPETGTVELSWSQTGQVDRWRVVVDHDGGVFFDETVEAPSATVTGLAYDQPLTVHVRAVAAGVASPPLTQHLPEFTWRPAAPQHLTVTPGETSLALHWQQPDSDTCQGWHVWWRRTADADPATEPAALDAAIPAGARADSGNVRACGEPALLLTDLEPDTEYELIIAAAWRTTSYSQHSLIERHRTGGGGGGPRVPRLRAGAATHHSVEAVWDDDPAATHWMVRRSPGSHVHQRVDAPRWVATGLSPDTEYTLYALAVNEATGDESDEGSIVLRTQGGTPPPPLEPPTPPVGLRVHCIHATHAKAEWEGNPPEQDIDRYDLRLTGPDTAEKAVLGTVQVLEGLRPEARYGVAVRAVNAAGASAWSTVEFKTGAEGPAPEPDPPGQVPAPTGLYVDPVAPGIVEAAWDAPADAHTWWLVSIDGLAHQQRVTVPRARLQAPPGQQRTVEVYAVVNGAGGGPAKLSSVARAGVVTARKGA